MSDFDGGAAAPAEGSATPEGAVLDTNPQGRAQPLGTQTPVAEKPQEPAKSEPSKTAGEAVRKAFEEVKAKEAAKATDPKDAPKPQQAKPDAAKPADAKLESQQRGDDGRFAPRNGQVTPQNPQEALRQQPAPQQAQPQQSAFRDAPARFDDAAKAEWEKTPEAIRGAIHRSVRELEQGHQKYKADAESYGELKEFDALAKQQGTTIKQALNHYVGMERLLRQDPIGGLERIVANLKLPSADGRALTLLDIAAHVMGQKPEERSARQSSEIQALNREIAGLRQQLGGVTSTIQQQRENEVLSHVETFKRDHPRFDELHQAILEEIQHGYDLPTAYERAERLNPAPAREPVIPADPALAHTQVPQGRQINPAGTKSIRGAPSSGSDPAGTKKGPAPSPRQALSNAFARLSG